MSQIRDDAGEGVYAHIFEKIRDVRMKIRNELLVTNLLIKAMGSEWEPAKLVQYFDRQVDAGVEIDCLRMELMEWIRRVELKVVQDLQARDKLKLIKNINVEFHRDLTNEQNRLGSMLKLLEDVGWANSIWWLFTILLDERVYGMDSRAVMGRLAEYDIQARPLWQPMHLSPAHRNLQGGPYAVSESLCRRGLSLPSSVGLQSVDQDRIICALVELAN